MKTPLWLAICVILTWVSIPAFGQDITIGVNLGVQLAHLNDPTHGEDAPSLPLHSPIGGITIDYDLAVHWALRFSLFLQTNGVKKQFYRTNEHGERVGEAMDIQLKLNYVSLPLLIHYQSSSLPQVYAGIGAYLSYLWRAQSVEPHFDMDLSRPSHLWDVDGKISRDISRSFKKMDVGLIGESGFKFSLRDNLYADFKVVLTHSILPITKNNGNQGTRYYNRTLGATLGVGYYW